MFGIAPQESAMIRFRPLTVSRATLQEASKPAVSLAVILAAFVAVSQIACALVRSGLSF
jgi:hypothetical protein